MVEQGDRGKSFRKKKFRTASSNPLDKPSEMLYNPEIRKRKEVLRQGQGGSNPLPPHASIRLPLKAHKLLNMATLVVSRGNVVVVSKSNSCCTTGLLYPFPSRYTTGGLWGYKQVYAPSSNRAVLGTLCTQCRLFAFPWETLHSMNLIPCPLFAGNLTPCPPPLVRGGGTKRKVSLFNGTTGQTYNYGSPSPS